MPAASLALTGLVLGEACVLGPRLGGMPAAACGCTGLSGGPWPSLGEGLGHAHWLLLPHS